MLLPGWSWHPLHRTQPCWHSSSAMTASPAEGKRVFFFPRMLSFAPEGFTLCSRGCWVQQQGCSHVQRHSKRGQLSHTSAHRVAVMLPCACPAPAATHAMSLQVSVHGTGATTCLCLTHPEYKSPLGMDLKGALLGMASHPRPGWKLRAGGWPVDHREGPLPESSGDTPWAKEVWFLQGQNPQIPGCCNASLNLQVSPRCSRPSKQ